MPSGLLLALAVGVGAGVGAQLRFAAERAHALYRERRGLRRPVFPWATLEVNIAGSAVIGLVAGLVHSATIDPAWQAVIGAGLAGGLTTFSTFALDVVELARTGHVIRALLDVLATLVLGLAAAAITFHLTW